MKRPHIVLDLDGTLTVDDKRVPYPERAPWTDVHDAAHTARSRGYGLIVLTARGMRTWKNVREDVERHVRPGVEAWLAHQDLAADAVHVAKPWCGPGGFYVDDRNLHIEEFLWRFQGPLAGVPVAVQVAGVPDRPLRDVWTPLSRLERWLDLVGWTFDDVDPTDLGHGLPGDTDPRDPARVLAVRIDAGLADPAAWFAAHHTLLDDRPFVVGASGPRAGFALVPPDLASTALTAPHTLPPDVVRRGWDGLELP